MPRQREKWNPPRITIGVPRNDYEHDLEASKCLQAAVKALFPGRQNKKNVGPALITARQAYYRASDRLRKARPEVPPEAPHAPDK